MKFFPSISISKLLSKGVGFIAREFKVKLFNALNLKQLSFVEEIFLEEDLLFKEVIGKFIYPGYIRRSDGIIDTSIILTSNYKSRLIFLPLLDGLSFRPFKIHDKEIESYFVPPLGWNKNFYHWLAEILPIIKFVYSEFDYVILVPKLNKMQLESMLFFIPVFDERRFVFIDEFSKENVCRFHYCPNIRIPQKNAVSLINPSLFNFYKKKTKDRNQIPVITFVSRSKGDGRCLLNEADLITSIEVAGYLVRRINPDKIPKEQLFEVLGLSDIIMGPHGAGLTNIMFTSKLAALVEIVGPGIVNGSFESLSLALGIPHKYIFSNNESDSNPLFGGSRVNFYLEKNQIEEILFFLSVSTQFNPNSDFLN